MCRAIVLQSNENLVTQITQTHSNVLIYFMNLVSFLNCIKRLLSKLFRFSLVFIMFRVSYSLFYCYVRSLCRAKIHEAQ